MVFKKKKKRKKAAIPAWLIYDKTGGLYDSITHSILLYNITLIKLKKKKIAQHTYPVIVDIIN